MMGKFLDWCIMPGWLGIMKGMWVWIAACCPVFGLAGMIVYPWLVSL